MADRKLKIDIRRGKILELLRQKGSVSVAQLSYLLNATTVTIRSDLTALERDGYLTRMQGGAVLRADRQSAGAGSIVNSAQKQKIATAVADRIRDGDTLLINSGTTTYFIAQALKSRKNLYIVTNSIDVAKALGDHPTFRVILLGGVINAQAGFTYGGDAQEQLERYQADWCILSVDGVSTKSGITTCHAEEAILDKMMIHGAKSVIVAADQSKIGKAGFTWICDCNSAVNLITEGGDPEELARLEEADMKVTIV